VSVRVLYATGSNNTGQLGLSHKTDKYTPTRVDLLYHYERDVKYFSCGARHNAAIASPLNSPGTLEVWTWGQGWFGRLGHGSEKFQLKPKLIKAFDSNDDSLFSLFSYSP
jgi:alpha-tubulin suppressor-like RCC1 family protein